MASSDPRQKKSFTRLVSQAYNRTTTGATTQHAAGEIADPLGSMDDEQQEMPLTARLKLNGALNALAPGPERGYAVVAGREVLKILHVTRESVTEEINMRVGSRLNLNFSSNDVAWGHSVTRSKIATAATNGAVVMWDYMRQGQKVDRIMTDHSRAVNRIRFDPVNGFLLVSASQDGTMKLWDIRDRTPVRLTFEGKSEAVRDICFNAANPVEFAAAFDNGSIQKWDIRKNSVFERKINAHNGIVLSIDWHPDGKTIASGGLDKTIRIWNFYTDPSPNSSANGLALASAMGISSTHNPTSQTSQSSISTSSATNTSTAGSTMRAQPLSIIRTMAPVAKVAWRQAHDFQICSASLSTDNRCLVWDVRRPYVPKMVIEQHDNSITGVHWAEKNIIWTCGKDRYFMQHDTKVDAHKALELLPKSCVSWSVWGDLAFVAEENTGREDLPFDQLDGFNPVEIGKKKKKKKNKVATEDLQMTDLPTLKYKPTQATGVVSLPTFDAASFIYLAENSVLMSDSVWEACERNAQLAWDIQHYRSCQTWKLLQLLYGTSPDEDEDSEVEASVASGDEAEESMLSQSITISESALPTTSALVSKQDFAKRRVKGLGKGSRSSSLAPSSAAGSSPPHGSLHVPSSVPSRRSNLQEQIQAVEETPSAIEKRQGKWSGLHRAMQQLSDEDQQSAVGDYYPYVSYDYGNEFGAASGYGSGYAVEDAGVRSGRTSKGQTPATSRGGSRAASVKGDKTEELTLAPITPSVKRRKSHDTPDDFTIGGGGDSMPMTAKNGGNMVSSVLLQPPQVDPARSKWDHIEYVKSLLDWYADTGDLQMCVAIGSLLGPHDPEISKWIHDSGRWEQWVWGYVDLLERFQLWQVRASLIRNSDVQEIKTMNQESTSMSTACHHCGKAIASSGPIPAFWVCNRCRKLQGGCSICHLPVKGRYAWCQGCGHGGHIDHIRDWFLRGAADSISEAADAMLAKYSDPAAPVVRSRSKSTTSMSHVHDDSVECPTGCGHRCMLFATKTAM